jgi:MFS transporter, AAHS family, 4-hydroxybenzoate transporter
MMTENPGADVRVDIAAMVDERPLGRRQMLLVVLVFLVMLLDGFDIALLSFLISPITREWNTSTGALAAALAAALLGTVIGAAAGGMITDRIGRRCTLIGSVLIFSVGTLLCSRVDNIAELTGLRLMSGLGFGAAFPCATALLAEWLPLRTRSLAISIINSGIPAGGLLGAGLCPWLLAELGWRATFVCGGIATLALGVVLIAWLPESIGYLAGRANSGARIADLLHRVLPDRPSFAPTTQWIITGTVLSTAADKTDRLFSASNLRVNIGLWSTFFMAGLGLYVFTNWMPVLLVKLGMPLSASIRGSLYFYAAAIVITFIAGLAITRVGSRATLLWLGSIAVLIVSWMAAVLLRTESLADMDYLYLVVGMGCAGGCIAGIYAVLFTIAAGAYPAHYRGSGVGLCVTAGRVAGIASIFLVSAIVSGGAPVTVFKFVAVAIVGILAGTFLIDRHVRRLPARPAAERA